MLGNHRNKAIVCCLWYRWFVLRLESTWYDDEFSHTESIEKAEKYNLPWSDRIKDYVFLEFDPSGFRKAVHNTAN